MFIETLLARYDMGISHANSSFGGIITSSSSDIWHFNTKKRPISILEIFHFTLWYLDMIFKKKKNTEGAELSRHPVSRWNFRALKLLINTMQIFHSGWRYLNTIWTGRGANFLFFFDSITYQVSAWNFNTLKITNSTMWIIRFAS